MDRFYYNGLYGLLTIYNYKNFTHNKTQKKKNLNFFIEIIY